MAMKRQVENGDLDYLVADYLAEVSMSILHKQMQQKPERGYVHDFIEHIQLAGEGLKKRFPKIITNAGGKNPRKCAAELQKVLSGLGLRKKVIAIVGDDLIPCLGEYLNKNSFTNLEDGRSFKQINESLVVANVYTSSEGIIKALSAGADVVITGRASDSALTIGPLVYEFGWKLDDWDKLAAGMVAGHLLECGAQASGGNFTDWKQIKSWSQIGFPIVEMQENGDFVVTKPKNTGGLINEWTIKEQLVYEIADPKNYLGPDVVADLTTMQVENIESNKVSVTGVTGKTPPKTWKVSMAYHNGYKAVGSIVVGGNEAEQKADLVSRIFWQRLGLNFKKTYTNKIGAGALGQSLYKSKSNEILLQFIAFDDDRTKLESFGKEVAGLILSGPQGLAAATGRPKVQEVIAYWPTLIDKSELEFTVLQAESNGDERQLESFSPLKNNQQYVWKSTTTTELQPDYDVLKFFVDSTEVEMMRLCLARSGDKGNSANIGVIARTKGIYDFLKSNLVPSVLNYWFMDLCQGDIMRFELNNLGSLNFMLTEVLDGGGTYSGRLDPQGKTLASALLAQKIWIPNSLLNELTNN
jgi:hypothetical protein